MPAMTLAGPNYGTPPTASGTGLGRGFLTPQKAKIERPEYYQNLDSFAFQNFNKPRVKMIQTLGPTEIISDS